MGGEKTFGIFIMEMISVAKGYRCPLCPDHQDDEDEFAWCNLLHAPICWGCTYDIYYGLVGWDERPTSEQYNHADTIELMEQITKKSFHQLKYLYIIEILEERTGTVPKFLKGLSFQDLSDSELRDLNEKLDYELEQLPFVRDAKSFKPKWEDKFKQVAVIK